MKAENWFQLRIVGSPEKPWLIPARSRRRLAFDCVFPTRKVCGAAVAEAPLRIGRVPDATRRGVSLGTGLHHPSCGTSDEHTRPQPFNASIQVTVPRLCADCDASFALLALGLI